MSARIHPDANVASPSEAVAAIETKIKTLLVIEISPMGDGSISRGIGKEFVDAWKIANPQGSVTIRDLNAQPIPHLDAEAIFAGYTPEESRSESAKAKFQFRLDLIAEITSVDDILITTPMWNWSIPSGLKAYFDQIIIPGVLDGSTHRKLAGKKFTAIVAEGGNYTEGDRKGWDYASGYLKTIAAALGVNDSEVIVSVYGLAGVAPGMESLVDAKAASIAAAKEAARKRVA